jgi:hypothetical protein
VHEPWGFCHQLTRRNPEAAFGVTKAAPSDPITPRTVDGLLEGLYASGLVAEDVLPSELSQLDLDRYRLIIFATMPVMDDAFRAFVRERLARNGRHVVALAQAGWSNGHEAGPDLGTAWHGFGQALQVRPKGPAMITVGEATERFECNTDVALPVVTDSPAGVEVLGRWDDSTPAAARRTDPEATWWVFSAPPITPAVWREVGRRAGAHVINDHDEPTLLGNGFLVVHSATGGHRTLRLPGGAVIDVTLAPVSTTVFDAETGERLLS